MNARWRNPINPISLSGESNLYDRTERGQLGDPNAVRIGDLSAVSIAELDAVTLAGLSAVSLPDPDAVSIAGL